MQRLIYKIIFILILFSILSYSQYGIPHVTNSNTEVKTGIMNGNRIVNYFRNNTNLNISGNRGEDLEDWPNDTQFKRMAKETRLLVSYVVYLDEAGEPVKNPEGAVDSVIFLETGYSDGNQGFLPLAGFSAEGSETPAMSNDQNTWPTNWPHLNSNNHIEKIWPGRNGVGKINADLETFFMTSNANSVDNDKSFKSRKNGLELLCEQRGYQWNSYPVDNAIIWEYNLTNISDYDISKIRLGLFRSNEIGGEEYPEGEIVFHKNGNLDTNMIKTTSYTWDVNFIPIERPNYPGLVGLSIGETPRNNSDQRDNDGDGLVDESPWNEPGEKVLGYNGINNSVRFRIFNHIDTAAWNDMGDTRYFAGDEDKDWIDGNDQNGNGVYDYGVDEPGSDLGTDGLGPYDSMYPGPDPDGTECNHRPDQGEPNFGRTDVGEADQINLSYYNIFTENNFNSEYSFDDPQSIAKLIMNNQFGVTQQTPSNYIELVATEDFQLVQEATQSLSFGEIHSYEPLAGLMDTEPKTPDLNKIKQVVDRIIFRDYEFSEPPIRPDVSVTSDDGKAIITWDNISSKFTNDHFMGDINDFEGYKIYKSTDPQMKDAYTVTNGYGELSRYKSIKVFDIINEVSSFVDYGAHDGNGYFLGSNTGIQNYFIDNSVQNGRKYYYAVVAFDKGLREYIPGESGVGFGVEGVGDGIQPMENDFIISEGGLNNTRNIGIANPRNYAAGYVSPNITMLDTKTFGTGWVSPEIFLKNKIKPGHKYKIEFEIERDSPYPESESKYFSKCIYYRNIGFRVYDVTDGHDSLVYSENENSFNGNNFEQVTGDTWPLTDLSRYRYVMNFGEVLTTGVFAGLKLNLLIPTEGPKLDKANTGWSENSDGNIDVNFALNVTPADSTPNYDHSRMCGYPFDFDIVFTNNQNAYKTVKQEACALGVFMPTYIDGNGEYHTDQAQNLLYEQNLNFYVLNRNKLDSLGRPDTMKLAINDVNNNQTYDPATDFVIVGTVREQNASGFVKGLWINKDEPFAFKFPDGNVPTSGSYQIRFERGFFRDDSILFKVNADKYVDSQIEEDMKKIKVVPNPYVCTNLMEPNTEPSQRERKLMFTHLPQECTISIFTITGMPIDRINVDQNTSVDEDEGIAYWDLKNSDGEDIAPGYYIYRIETDLCDKTIVDKFAIIK
ncbi:MAG: hypothetical protein K9M80_02680 [Candidatus Marinimicrobia bacterium]|nr:hypothetical protein [Candidatus Neomarinimicrobiota bacterium]